MQSVCAFCAGRGNGRVALVSYRARLGSPVRVHVSVLYPSFQEQSRKGLLQTFIHK